MYFHIYPRRLVDMSMVLLCPWGVVFPMVTLTMSTYQIHTDTEWRFFKIIGRVLAAILTLTACYIHALTIKHAVTPKFWHGFHPKQT